MVDLKFQLPLPEVPLGPRFLTVDSLANLGDLVRYREVVPLASRFKYPLHSDISLGVEIDTIDRKKWQAPVSNGASLPPSLHPDDAAFLEWELFQGRQKREAEDGEGGREGGEDTEGVATAADVAAPWMLRPRYETAVTYDSQQGREGGGAQGRKGRAEGEEGEEDGREVLDETRQEGWEAAIARSFEEAQRGEGLGPREAGERKPAWVAELVPDAGQWASELMVVQFGNEVRGREEEAAQEAPLFAVEGGREGEGWGLGRTVKAGYYRGQGHASVGEAREGGGFICKRFEPVRYYHLEVGRADGRGGVGGPEGAQGRGTLPQQQVLLLVDPEAGGASLCPISAVLKVKKMDRAVSEKPARGVSLVHRPLSEEEEEARRGKLRRVGWEGEEGAGRG